MEGVRHRGRGCRTPASELGALRRSGHITPRSVTSQRKTPLKSHHATSQQITTYHTTSQHITMQLRKNETSGPTGRLGQGVRLEATLSGGDAHGNGACKNVACTAIKKQEMALHRLSGCFGCSYCAPRRNRRDAARSVRSMCKRQDSKAAPKPKARFKV